MPAGEQLVLELALQKVEVVPADRRAVLVERPRVVWLVKRAEDRKAASLRGRPKVARAALVRVEPAISRSVAAAVALLLFVRVACARAGRGRDGERVSQRGRARGARAPVKAS